ncbi:MAG TPA: PQQ-binding-like beta-propeller repeat protein, partial [Pirellulales bacterium]|nr:PQQ-binding-like beta-propeller repeat protein [Pirellulales bacterium]
MPRPREVLGVTCRCAALVLLAALGTSALAQDRPGEWPCYGRDAGGTRYSPLAQIDRTNVQRLKVAWTYRTGELDRIHSRSLLNKATFEATPLAIDGVLYFSTPTARVIALKADTGAELWTYDAELDQKLVFAEGASRGVSYWRSNDKPAERRLFFGTLDARCIAIDADSGRPCTDFGQDGAIDLAADLPRATRGLYAVTSPPAVVGDVVIVGSAIADNGRFDASPGVVRAFDARTGKLVWSWDPIPRKVSDPGYETWKGEKALKTGAANVWSIISVDAERGLVFLPTTCPSPDYYGGERLGDNLFANSAVALEAKSGKMLWHFQVVRHDIWDYDIAAQPVLFSLERDNT